MTSLSRAAQAVLDAYIDEDRAGRLAIAAALRAAADQEKLEPDHWEGSRPDDYERGWNAALRKISRIAAELEGQ
jgi:DNA primase